MRRFLDSALNLVFPPQAWDGGARPMTSGLSGRAWEQITFIEQPACDGCATPYPYDLQSLCPACQARPRAFRKARAACLYDDASRDLILQFKHADRTDLAPLLSSWLVRAGSDLLEEADAIAPVPLHPSRLFRRRYNQAAELARPIARQTGLAYLPDALARRRATTSQGGKSGSGRRRNVAGAFEVVRPTAIAGRAIVLVDDVFTTGATTEACTRALLRAGAKSVDILVLARVKDAQAAPI